MSDIMLNAVIQMPYEMAMNDELSRRQFYERANQALDERNAKAAEIERLRKALRQEAGWHDDRAKNYRARRGISQTPVSDGLLAEWHKQRAQSIRAALSGEPNA